MSRDAFDVAFYAPFVAGIVDAESISPPGGAETQILMIANGLAARGLRVALITYPVARADGLASGVELIQRSASVLAQRRGLGKLAEVREIARVLREVKATVVVQRAAGYDTGIVAAVTRLGRRKFVYSSANVVDFEFARLERKRRNRFLYAAGLRLADEIVVQTSEQVALAERAGRSAVEMIPSIASLGARVEACDDPEYVLWVGRLTSYKRPLQFLSVAEQMPDVPIVFVGVPSHDAADLGDEALERARSIPNVRVQSPLRRRELLDVMRRAAVNANTAEYEGMPNVFLEGWLLGVPAAALHHDPDGVIEREGLGTYAAGSHERFRENLEAMWRSKNDPEVRRRCVDYVSRVHGEAAVVDRWRGLIARLGQAA